MEPAGGDSGQAQQWPHRNSYWNRKAGRDVEYEGRGIDITSDGESVLETFKGKGRQENPTTIRFEGETHYQTTSKKLAWLNNTTGKHEGTYNNLTGEASARLYGKG